MNFLTKNKIKLTTFIHISLWCLGLSLAWPLLRFLGGTGSPSFSAHTVFYFMNAVFAVFFYFICGQWAKKLYRVFAKAKARPRLDLLENTAEMLLQTLDFRELANLSVNSLGEIMRFKSVVLVVYQEAADQLRVASAYGISLALLKKIRLEALSPACKFLKTYARPISREALLDKTGTQAGMLPEFAALSADYFLPLAVDELWGGFLAVKFSRECNAEEWEALNDFCRWLALALRNAGIVEEYKQIAEKLKSMQSKIMQSNKLAAIEQLAAGLAHEIHNPLAIISGKAQLLLLKKDLRRDDKGVEDALRVMVKQCERAADITRKLLMFSDPISSGSDAIDFESIMESTLSLVSYQAVLDEITIVKEIAPDLPLFRGEINEIREVFLNLILNAAQAVEKRGTVSVRIQYLPEERMIEVRVQDNGRGIEPQHIANLFSPFFHLREGGLGLGLFLSQQIINRYHGSIHLESEPGVGTLVVVHLPPEQQSLKNYSYSYEEEIRAE